MVASRNQTIQESPLSSGSQESSSKNTRDYSILPIAVAMYLLLSIAPADLWSGLALVWEGRGSGDFVWFTSRRVFGAFLLVTFGAMITASTRVLFYSSFENVDLVLGATSVLFISDIVRNLSEFSQVFLAVELVRIPHSRPAQRGQQESACSVFSLPFQRAAVKT